MGSLGRRLALLLLSAAAEPMLAADPVVTDSRVISEERRLQILEAKLASLQREVSLLEDRKAIERLQQAFGHYLSDGLAAEAAALFSVRPPASIEFAQQGVFEGRARIQAFLSATGVKPRAGELRETPIMQPVVTIAPDGRTAKGRWRSLVLAGQHGHDGQWLEGPYENEYIKEDGIWRISKLHWFVTVSSSYDQGWHRAAYPVPGPLATLPPDRPPSVIYRGFPAFFLAPFHYFNPVTGRVVAWDTPTTSGAP